MRIKYQPMSGVMVFIVANLCSTFQIPRRYLYSEQAILKRNLCNYCIGIGICEIQLWKFNW